MLRPPALGTEAVLEYSNSDYRIIRQGTFVRCGVTGARTRTCARRSRRRRLTRA